MTLETDFYFLSGNSDKCCLRNLPAGGTLSGSYLWQSTSGISGRLMREPLKERHAKPKPWGRAGRAQVLAGKANRTQRSDPTACASGNSHGARQVIRANVKNNTVSLWKDKYLIYVFCAGRKRWAAEKYNFSIGMGELVNYWCCHRSWQSQWLPGTQTDSLKTLEGTPLKWVSLR